MLDGWFNTPRKTVLRPWEKWFAWYPVVLHGKRVWMKTVYRRRGIQYFDMNDYPFYEYGTIFDLLKSDE